MTGLSDQPVEIGSTPGIRAINPVTRRLVAERTAYASQLIPVTQYVTVSCIEAFLRYPTAVEAITSARTPEEIGEAARRPGCQADSVFLGGWPTSSSLVATS
ncbi:MAG: hypothetical protein Ct9H300mP12_05550 [Acidimicrobiales bacterium]|nr:MAG: hypothetical protein Ct9H300mP12_05550 [Acidimicrobiales bacterium]